jgi:hypothetical protein
MGDEIAIAERAAGGAVEAEVLRLHTVSLRERRPGAYDHADGERDDQRSLEPVSP